MDENRIRIVALPERLLLDVFNWWCEPLTVMLKIEHEQLPDGCRVISVHPNYATRSIDVVVSHETFDPVNAGERIPTFPAWDVKEKMIRFDSVEKPVDAHPETPWRSGIF